MQGKTAKGAAKLQPCPEIAGKIIAGLEALGLQFYPIFLSNLSNPANSQQEDNMQSPPVYH